MKGRMPTGVISWTATARMMQVKPEKPRLLEKELWDESMQGRLEERRHLFAQVRAGDPRAIERLRVEYRARIYWEITPTDRTGSA